MYIRLHVRCVKSSFAVLSYIRQISAHMDILKYHLMTEKRFNMSKLKVNGCPSVKASLCL